MPRLPDFAARPRVAELARLDVEQLRLAGSRENGDVVFAPVGGTRIARAALDALADTLRGVADDHGWPRPLAGSVSIAACDHALACALLDAFPVSPAEAGIGDVWAYLALALIPDVALWRFPVDAQGAPPPGDRLLGTDLTRHVFARLWWRAFLLRTSNPDGESGMRALLAAIGEADIDQIHSRRTAFGGSPVVFQAIVGIYAERNGLPREAFRAWLRRILRNGAFLHLDALERQELRESLEAILDAGNEGPVASAGGSRREERPGSLSDCPIAEIPRLLAAAIQAEGRVPSAGLAGAFERHVGWPVEPRWLNGFALVAKGLGTVAQDGEEWVPGTATPTRDPRWGTWTFGEIVGRAGDLVLTGEPEPLEALTAEIYSGKPTRTVKRVMRDAIKAASA
jgi:hypothetical protein